MVVSENPSPSVETAAKQFPSLARSAEVYDCLGVRVQRIEGRRSLRAEEPLAGLPGLPGQPLGLSILPRAAVQKVGQSLLRGQGLRGVWAEGLPS